MEDRSLDDFVGAGASDEEAGASDEAPGTSDEETDDAADSDAADSDAEASETDDESGETGPDAERVVDPAAATARVDPDGVDCPECGERVERRWRTDGGAFVCAACKEW